MNRTRPSLPTWLVVLCVAGAACSGGADTPVVAEVDGGTPPVTLLGDTVVAAAPGQTVTLHHASAPDEANAESPVTHAFIGGAPRLPPVFSPAAGGVAPNAAVWGPCRGGDPAQADDSCPIPPVEGPQAWDGTTYWSTGAMVPGESRDVVLADDIAPGEHVLVCVLHPQLRVVIAVGGQGSPERGDPARTSADVLAAVEQLAPRDTEDATVDAGLLIAEPLGYVATFDPATVTIQAGESVTWNAGARTPVDIVFNADVEELSLAHTEPADGAAEGDAAAWDGRGTLRSGFLSGDGTDAGAVAASWTVTFTRPGRYAYASRFGGQLRGTVIVEGP